MPSSRSRPAFAIVATLTPRAQRNQIRRLSPPPASHALIAGVDEVGAGPLAGPVVACAVLLHPRLARPPLPHLDDSKRLTARRRARLAAALRAHPAFILAYGECSPSEIDRDNILNARLEAMARAVRALPIAPQLLFVDGNRTLPAVQESVAQEAVVGGDARVEVVAMASVLAKVCRDELMVQMDARFPGYGFARHKGYGTKMHVQALLELGPCAIHRRSFRPVREAEQRMEDGEVGV